MTAFIGSTANPICRIDSFKYFQYSH